MSRWRSVLRTPVGACAALLLVGVLALAVLAPILWSAQADRVDTDAIRQGMSAEHWAGTDDLGRDLFFRVLVATRLSVELALLATLIAVVVGLTLGALPALVGSRLGRYVVAFVNITVAFPGLLLALFLAVIFGVGARGAVLAIGLAGAPAFARLTQTLVAGVIERDYVAAARAAGIGRFRVLLRHVLPNIAEPLIVNATISAGGALLAFAGLSFLGLGVQAPQYDWGRLLGDGLAGIYVTPAAALAPGIAVVIAGLAFNLFGEALAKAVGLTTPLGRALPRLPRRTDSSAPSDAVLEVRELTVTLPSGARAVRGVSLQIAPGEAVGVVGESGSGKSLTALAIAQLVEEPLQVRAERLHFQGADLQAQAHRKLLGTSLAMVFQDPMTAFNPTQRIASQLAEGAREHGGLSRQAARARVIDRLRAVRIHDPERRARQYPHEFSGGMRQRAMIGMGLMGTPALIIADEPTTALDVTVQQQILQLLAEIRAADHVALLLISHDVTVVSAVCDRVLVMYAGRVVEDLPAAELARGARHPYTRALVAAVPTMESDRQLPLTVIPGRMPDPDDVSAGCSFAPRCALADAHCAAEQPELIASADGRRIACWHPAPASLALQES
ncbi:dipeptide/oligopeptide/nickel ABC transporter permease/ATP-binding protein [Kribbella sandramycini]|uniref:Dipeptide/oligopeptide/nickel ABC transporter permease/ATP-binding protein n=1 Tax=Kribbella sandramycini TaxID=60450 RepID=A0A7Y4NY42_9ACTN|nr:dipeptide/oligopeptide/nickel ABC transporter permease/ATP-binding protein [Kribbella sandramycini]MBB6567255.1 oligopeptide/dipeptide ABC transporter ATP-binding protein [Kribbella sandramycini]NOL40131.1 dipeptide/oligopeptide/nickel ABC transporter permease/ATP-binding protein [Kribbella sandramycini]